MSVLYGLLYFLLFYCFVAGILSLTMKQDRVVCLYWLPIVFVAILLKFNLISFGCASGKVKTC